MKKSCVLCYGCPENLLDAARIKAYLKENGWQIVDDYKSADLILFNTCAWDNEAAKTCVNTIRNIRNNIKDSQQLIVSGCLPKIDPAALSQVYQGSTFGEGDLYRLEKIVNAIKPIDEVTANDTCSRFRIPKHPSWKPINQVPARLLHDFYDHLNSNIGVYRENDRSIFYIKISTGCLGHCAYCAISLSRGKIKSKPIETIINEFRAGLNRGFKEFSLLGTDLGPYGRDLGFNLADLLREMIKESGKYKIGLRNMHPLFLKQMLDDLEPIVSTGKIWFTGVAAESGSNRILKLMRRGYTVEDFRECIHRLRMSYPDLLITTQMIVGFPTETDQDFKESLRLLDEIRFDSVEVFQFSPRSGTPAAEMKGQIHEKIVRYRENKMLRKVLLYAMNMKIVRLQHNIFKTRNIFT